MSRTLSTPRLILQPLTADDHAALLAHWTDPLVRRYLFDDKTLTAAEVTEIIAASRHDFAVTGYGLWAIRLRAACPHLIGVAGLRRMEDEEQLDGPGPPQPDVEIVYSLQPAHWGRGLVVEAAGAVLRYAFEILELGRVLAEIDEGNDASAAVAERLGLEPFETVTGVLGPMTHYAAYGPAWLAAAADPQRA